MIGEKRYLRRDGRENETPRAIKARCSRNSRGQVYRWQTVIRIIIGECAKHLLGGGSRGSQRAEKAIAGDDCGEGPRIEREKKTIPRLSARHARRELLPRDRFNWYGSAPNGLTTIRRNRLCLVRGHAARLVPPSRVHSPGVSNENGGAYTGNLCSAKVGSHNLVTSSATERYKSTYTGCRRCTAGRNSRL